MCSCPHSSSSSHRWHLIHFSFIFISPNNCSSPLCSGESRSPTRLGKSVVLEDNAACIALAHDGDKHRPRTHHLTIKWHHFRDQIRDGWLTVQKVASVDNWSDIFTKPLARDQFRKLRDEMMGWKVPLFYPFTVTAPTVTHRVPRNAAAAFAQVIPNDHSSSSPSFNILLPLADSIY